MIVIIIVSANASDITVTFDDLEVAKTYFLQVATNSRSKRSDSNLFPATTRKFVALKVFAFCYFCFFLFV